MTLAEALEALPSYRHGRDRAPLEVVAAHVRQATAGKQREALERHLLGILHARATVACKEFVCLQLQDIGSAQSVPLLSKLLANKRLGHAARVALTKIPAPEAGVALRAAIGKLSGKRLIGAIDSVAARRDEEAVEALYELVCRGKQSSRAAAIAALGKIGGAASADALAKAAPKVPVMFRPAVAAARLRCAKGLLEAGKQPLALQVYEQIALGPEARVIRHAALRSMVAIQPGKAVRALAVLLTCEDVEMRAAARDYVVRLPSREVTVALGQELGKLPVSGQAALLEALAARGDAVARPAVVKATASESKPTRIAAIRALGRLGDATTVSLLAELAATGGEDQRAAARSALQEMPGKAVDQAILWALQAAKPQMKVELIRSLSARKAEWAVPELMTQARHSDSRVAAQAFSALGGLAEGQFLAELVSLLVRVTSDEVRPAAEGAVAACAARISRPDRRCRPVVAAMEGASIPVRCSLLRVLSRIGGAGALEALRRDVEHPAEEVRDVAVRALARCDDPAVAGELLQIARRPSNDAYHVLALGRYLDFAAARAKEDPSGAVGMYRDALAAARRAEERNRILSSLGQIPDPAALEMALEHLEEEATQDAAAASIVRVADAIAFRHRETVTAALQKVLKASRDWKIRSRAGGVLNRLKRCQDHILVWAFAGPYGEDGKGPMELIDAVFDPETGRAVQWQPLCAGADRNRPWAVVLSDVYKARNCVGYARTRVWSPQGGAARLEMGSDDGLKAWLNGQEVHRVNRRRRISPGQDKVPVELTKGWNILLLKIVQADGEWALCARLRRADGGKLEGIRTKAD